MMKVSLMAAVPPQKAVTENFLKIDTETDGALVSI